MAGEKIQADHANENGDIEQRHHRFKTAIDQALMLRGSRNFASREAYADFLHQRLAFLNAGRRERLKEDEPNSERCRLGAWKCASVCRHASLAAA
jgi:hypothetical protein